MGVYLLLDEAAPPGPLDDDAAPPLVPLLPPVLLEAAPPGLDEETPPGLDELIPPLLVDDPPLVLPMPLPGLVLELELEPLGLLGVVVDDEEDEPPGTTIVSFSLVTVLVDEGDEPPGTTTVSLRSQAESARAPISTSK